MKRFHTLLTAVLLCTAAATPAAAQPAMTNVYGRDCQLLNGKWAAIMVVNQCVTAWLCALVMRLILLAI